MEPDLFLLDSGPDDAAWNMALDEALLLGASALGLPVLRFYGWNEPAATFGYFQRLAEVELATTLRPLIRRPTGGGIVPHDRDWTYSLVVPPDHPWHALKATESYQAMHQWVARALGCMHVEVELAECCRKVLPGQCFEGWEKHDILRAGRKIGGAAQRRNRCGLLIQGSIHPPTGLDRSEWHQAMGSVAGGAGFRAPGRFPQDRLPRTEAHQLRSERYAQMAYNAMR